jgi:hypothetical protein
MKSFVLLLGAFLVTFALLISVWMFGTGHSPFEGLTATPTPAPTEAPTLPPTLPPTPQPTATVTPTASPTSTPTAGATPTPTAPSLATPSLSPAPLRTPPPSDSVLPSSQPGNSHTYTMTGIQYTSYQMPDQARLVRNGDSLVLVTTSETPDVLWVTYSLDPALLPAGVIIHSVDAAICGQGGGTFYEIYGPTGSDPTEYEVTPPDPDGCWHFRDAATTDMSAIVSTMLDSQLVIDRVEFTVTFGS